MAIGKNFWGKDAPRAGSRTAGCRLAAVGGRKHGAAQKGGGVARQWPIVRRWGAHTRSGRGIGYSGGMAHGEANHKPSGDCPGCRELWYGDWPLPDLSDMKATPEPGPGESTTGSSPTTNEDADWLEEWKDAPEGIIIFGAKKPRPRT